MEVPVPLVGAVARGVAVVTVIEGNYQRSGAPGSDVTQR
jgi:hypothetical protein